MKQADLNRAVARATGESVRMIRSLGFTVLHRQRRARSRRRAARLSADTAYAYSHAALPTVQCA
jgi:hypothetical protein